MTQKIVSKFGTPMEVLTKDQMKALWGSSTNTTALKQFTLDNSVCYMCCNSDFSYCTACDTSGNGGCTIGTPVSYCCTGPTYPGPSCNGCGTLSNGDCPPC